MKWMFIKHFMELISAGLDLESKRSDPMLVIKQLTTINMFPHATKLVCSGSSEAEVCVLRCSLQVSSLCAEPVSEAAGRSPDSSSGPDGRRLWSRVRHLDRSCTTSMVVTQR